MSALSSFVAPAAWLNLRAFWPKPALPLARL